MTELDKKEFAKIVVGVFEAYAQEPTKEQLRIYFNCLLKFSIDEVRAAFEAHIVNPDDGKFLPRPADIVRAIIGTSKSNALIAIGKVMNAVRRVGRYPSVVFDDEIIMMTIENMGGWLKFCMVTDSELPFFENAFKARYEYYYNHPMLMYSERLLGESEARERGLNAGKFEVAYIGDEGIEKKMVLGLGNEGVNKIGNK